jgi:hypothetical protein
MLAVNGSLIRVVSILVLDAWVGAGPEQELHDFCVAAKCSFMKSCPKVITLAVYLSAGCDKELGILQLAASGRAMESCGSKLRFAFTFAPALMSASKILGSSLQLALWSAVASSKPRM